MKSIKTISEQYRIDTCHYICEKNTLLCSFVVGTSISYGRKSFEMSLRPQLRMVGRKDKYFPKFQ